MRATISRHRFKLNQQPRPTFVMDGQGSMHGDPSTEMDLTMSEPEPGPEGVVTVERTMMRDSSSLNCELQVWKVRLAFNYHVQGPLSWFAPLCALILLLGIVAAVAVPHLALADGAAADLRAAVAGVSGASILLIGVSVLIYLLGKRSR